jgi:hypothetical protein
MVSFFFVNLFYPEFFEFFETFEELLLAFGDGAILDEVFGVEDFALTVGGGEFLDTFLSGQSLGTMNFPIPIK